ncbi:MAG: SusC/RagA family TonB-linked outer membrane protein, partial [Chitinophagaceae bacterium]
MKLKIALLSAVLAASGSGVFAQELTVTGRVTNANNEPLSGVTVTVAGSKSAVTTNAQGQYSITVPKAGTTLRLSYVGMETQDVVVSGSGSPVNVSLAGAAGTMNEVVVVGYGQQRKAVVTGAISSVKADQIKNVSNTRLEQT